MKFTDFLPLRLRGVVDLFYYHPFWHPRYREDFGRTIVVLSALFQLSVLVLLISRDSEMWPLWIFVAFVAGSLGALFACTEVSIFRLRRQGVRSLLILQAIGLGLIGASFLFARQPRSFSSVADGLAFYPFVIGLITFVSAPLAIWEGTRA